MERRRFFLTTIIGGVSILGVVSTADAVILRGKVVVKPASSDCSTLDVVANVRTVDSQGQLRGERDLATRATATQSGGSRFKYRLDVPPLSDREGDTDQITVSARCNGGSNPLVQPTVKSGWQNPFTSAPAAAASTTSGGSSSVARNFKVRLNQLSDAPSQIVLAPSSTDAFGSVGYSGSSVCDAEPPAFPGSDPLGTIAGTSNEPGNGCEMHTQMSGVLRFDLSGIAPYSERIASAELRYTESAIEWRNPDGSPTVPLTCVSALTPNPAPDYAWGMTHAVGDDTTIWDVTDLVTYWSENTNAPQVTLAPVQVANDAFDAACLSQVSNVELVITLDN